VQVTTVAGAATVVTDGMLCAGLPGVSGWSAFRITKISAYNLNTGQLGVATTQPTFVALIMPADRTFLDANDQTFVDHGVPGAAAAALHVTPAFVQRERWYQVNATGTIGLFSAGCGPTTGVTAGTLTILFHVSIELVSNNETPAFRTLSTE